jgi:hypothetical protein
VRNRRHNVDASHMALNAYWLIEGIFDKNIIKKLEDKMAILEEGNP